MNVYRSLSNIYAQVINDVTGETIVAASTVEKDLKANYGGNTEAAKAQEISNLARYTIYAPNYGTTDSFGGQSYGTCLLYTSRCV